MHEALTAVQKSLKSILWVTTIAAAILFPISFLLGDKIQSSGYWDSHETQMMLGSFFMFPTAVNLVVVWLFLGNRIKAITVLLNLDEKTGKFSEMFGLLFKGIKQSRVTLIVLGFCIIPGVILFIAFSEYGGGLAAGILFISAAIQFVIAANYTFSENILQNAIKVSTD